MGELLFSFRGFARQPVLRGRGRSFSLRLGFHGASLGGMKAVLEKSILAAGLRRGEKLLVAVSGGIDSVVLLHLLVDVVRDFGLSLHVAHLDHQIRPQGADDAEFVRQLCVELQVPCVVESYDVPALARAAKLSLEMAGRQARREFLLRTADAVGARLIALAHHRDDQVETFMLRLLRGSGVAGLAAMAPLRGRWWRPLLDCSRAQIAQYAEMKILHWVEDQSNADPVFLRNRLRHQLLPSLRSINPQIDGRIAELGRQLQVDEDYWTLQVEALFPELIVSAADGLRLRREKLLALHGALRVRVLREALRRVRGDLQRLEAVHLQAIDELLRSGRSQAQLDLPGCWVARRYESLWLRGCAPESAPNYDFELPVPGAVCLPCGRVLRAQLMSESTGESAEVVEFALAKVGAGLRVRSWRPGDRFAPAGVAGTKKLKRLFGDEKLESEERSRVPVLVAGGQVLWVVGVRRSCHAPVADGTAEILRVELLKEA